MGAQKALDVLSHQFDWVQRYLTDLYDLIPRPLPDQPVEIARKKNMAVAPDFFSMVGNLLYDAIILELCKMVDDKAKGTLTITMACGERKGCQ